MKPLEVELVLLYCRQARGSIARVVQLTAEQRDSDGEFETAIDETLASLAQLERQINKATRHIR